MLELNRFKKGDLVVFDSGLGTGQANWEPGRVVEISFGGPEKKNVIIVEQTNVSAGLKPRLYHFDDLSLLRKHPGVRKSAKDGKLRHFSWFDEEAGIDDMIQLSELKEENILQNLEIRFKRNVIYTSIGSILVAVNPYRMLSEMYSVDTVKTYENHFHTSELPPHLFAIGSSALSQMIKEQEDQVVVISGESGAGKTESTKLIMQYLAAVNKAASNLVTEQILEANPLLESFGNAKTMRNDNSSRFGKYLSIYYNKEGFITGAKITEYLLEKSRICTHGEDERNYHIFYEILAGLTKDEKLQYGLQDEKAYYYLNQGGDTKLPAKNDATDFQALKSAMQVLNFTTAERDTVFKILAAVLHLGNIRFKAKQEEYQLEGVVVERESEVRWIAHLLQISDAGIEKALTTKTTEARNEKLLTALNRDQAFDARDAIAKALYSRLFTWLVDRTNQIVAHDPNRNTSIALLDIFGFEDFKDNSFEQLCINYANETLQFYFNQHIFKLEQQEYSKEKILWHQIEFIDNQPVLDLIAKKPIGIFLILDDECNFPKATDQSFLEKCHYNHATNLLYLRPRTLQHSFAVRHYAGQVSYNVAGFLDKNRDTLRADVIELFIASGVTMVSRMFQEWKDSSDFVKTVKRGAGRFVTMKPRTPTVSARFQESLNLLVENMSKCRPHFVRCIKPNNSKSSTVFDTKLVLDQLKYTGMLETIRIRKIGYPVRIKFLQFKNQYECLLRNRKLLVGSSVKDSCRLILEAFSQANPPPTSFKSKMLPEYQLGSSKVFLRESFQQKLQTERIKVLEDSAIVIQRNVRGYLQRKKFLERKKAAIKIQSQFRGFRQRKQYQQVKTGITRAQATVKMRRQRRLYLETMNKSKELKALEGPKRTRSSNQKDLRQKSDPTGNGIQNSKLSPELASILNQIDEWQSPHSERNVTQVVGQFESISGTYRYELPRDTDAFSFQKFAGIYCKNRSWGPRREPIQEPFLTNLHDKDKKQAIEIFKLVLTFICDLTLNDRKEKALADYIAYQGVTNEHLRDEIYCQLCNQTWPPELLSNINGNASMSSISSLESGSIERAWFLLLHCLSTFPPSSLLSKHLLKYISDYAIDLYRHSCQVKLLQYLGHESGPSRIYPPTLLETKTNKKSALMALEVIFPDAERRTGQVTSWTTSSEFAKYMLSRREIVAGSNGWTTMLVSSNADDLVELNGTDYLLDLLSEMELPPAFPARKPVFLHSRCAVHQALIESDYIGKMDFGDEDEDAAGSKLRDGQVTRLGLAKDSRLNQRYESDKSDLAKTSALNKRYILTDAGIAIGMDPYPKTKGHPGLSGSELNKRYTSSMASGENRGKTPPAGPLSKSSKLNERYRQESRPGNGGVSKNNDYNDSDMHSVGSHFQRVRVPTSANSKDIDNYLDEIFDPVLQNGEFTDDDEFFAKLDAKTLATSIRGGRGKPSKAAPESNFQGTISNGGSQQVYHFGGSIPPTVPNHPPYNTQMSAAGMTPLGYYPQIGSSMHPFYYYPNPAVFPMRHARSSEFLDNITESEFASRMRPRTTFVGHPQTHAAHFPYSNLRSYSVDPQIATDHLGYGQVLIPAPTQSVDPVIQQYFQQQTIATQIHLQQQLADALQQNIELQRKLLENQVLAPVHQRNLGGSDGLSSDNASPDSLPPTPPGVSEPYLFQNRPSREPKRSTTPLPTKSVIATDPSPPLPPRKMDKPVKVLAANIPPPPPPPPPLPPKVKSPELKKNIPGFSEQITGRANTIRIGGIRWPPPRELPPPQDESPEIPRRPLVNQHASGNQHVEAPEIRKSESTKMNKLRMELENIVGNSLTLKEKPQSQSAQQPPANRISNLQQHKLVKLTVDNRGIPVPPPPPPGTNTPHIKGQIFSKENLVQADIHNAPRLAGHPDGMKKSTLDPVPDEVFFTYNKTRWNIMLRKEFFTPKEKVENPLAANLIFAQIRQDTFRENCLRMSKEEQSKMRALFESHGISGAAEISTGSIKTSTIKPIIDAAKELSLYFCRLYPVAGERVNGAISRALYLGISHSGVSLARLEKDENSNSQRLRVDGHCSLEDILEVTVARKSTVEISFLISNASFASKKTTWSLYTEKAPEIKDLINQMTTEFDQIAGGGTAAEFVRAVMDYRTKDPTLLNFRRGEIIKLATRGQSYLDKGWLYGNIADRWGIFPHEYVTALSRQELLHLKSEAQNKTEQTAAMGRTEKQKESRMNGLNSPTSSNSTNSSGSEGDIVSRANDGKLSMLEFALFNFRQSIEKFGVLNPQRKTSTTSNTSSIQGSIKQIEKLKDESGKEWTWREQAEMVKFTRSPITHSLLKFDDPAMDDRAVKAFLCLMKFTGDYPLSKAEEELECVYKVLMVCHQYPALRDEIYCQIIKQTTNNKSVKPDSCQRGWRYFSIIAAYFDCSENLRPYMFNYLEKAAYDKRRPYHGTALVCLQNLRKTFKYGGRKNVPNEEEIAAIAAGRSSKRQIYLLPGGTEKVLNTKSTTVVEDVISDLCGQLNIDVEYEMDEYSLYAMRDREDMYGVPLQHGDYILDISTEILKNGQSFFMLFRRSVWYFPLRTSDPTGNPIYIDMMFHQVVPDYLDGLLLVSPPGGLLDEEIRELGKIAALLHRSTDKNVAPTINETKYLLPKPALSLRDPRPQQWLQIVQDYFQVTLKLTPVEAKAEFLNMLQRWTLFGSSFFFVNRYTAGVPETPKAPNSTSSHSSSETSKKAEKLLVENILAINRSGVFFLDVESRETIVHHPFSEIISTRRIKSNEDGALYLDMKCGSLLSQKIIRMQTSQAHEIARLIGHYIHIENSVLASKAARSNAVIEMRTSLQNDNVLSQ